MPSEWAMKKADDLHMKLAEAQRDYLDAADILAEAIDAARIKGMEEAAEAAIDGRSATRVIGAAHAGANIVIEAIRAAIEAQKAGKG